MSTVLLFHIVLSTVASLVLGVAGIQAMLLAVQEHLVRYRPNSGWTQKLPPLVVMEKRLFITATIGFLLLSLLLFTSLYFFRDAVWADPLLWQKTALVICAWVIFAILLLGRFLWGWRGRKVIYAILGAVMLLMMVYLGSQFFMEGMH